MVSWRMPVGLYVQYRGYRSYLRELYALECLVVWPCLHLTLFYVVFF